LTNLEKGFINGIVSAMNEKIEYPIRINRYLYINNICSRREADRMIEKGQIYINNKKAVLGQKVEEGDEVTLSGHARKKVGNYIYYAVNKPRGIESHGVGTDSEDIISKLELSEKVSVVGRLDKDSSGLLLLTNDGRIVDKMLNPKYDHQKEYVVKVDKDLKESFKRKMESGVDIEGYMTKPTKVTVTDKRLFRIILTEGKKHQIRRMLAALGYTTIKLKRVRIMNILLGKLKEGEYRKLTDAEKNTLLKSLDII